MTICMITIVMETGTDNVNVTVNSTDCDFDFWDFKEGNSTASIMPSQKEFFVFFL